MNLCLFIFLAIALTKADSKKEITYNFPNNTYRLYTGYINVNQTTNTSLFYTLTTAANKNLTDPNPLILWMQGGPGCSSLFGTWLEFGPFIVVNNSGNLEVAERNITWGQYYHILTVDNPCTVGYNLPGTCNITNALDAEVQVYDFLVSFFQEYPELEKNPFYVMGESYGGKYIPFVAYNILMNGAKGFNFEGIMIGNPWTHPFVQIDVFARSSYSMGVIEMRARDYITLLETEGQQDILNDEMTDGTNMFNDIEIYLTQNDVSGGIFLNNYRDYSATEPINALSGITEIFLNSESTKELFGVPVDLNYQICNGEVYLWWFPDFMTDVSDILSFVLENTRVLLYNGADDIEVNTSGVIDFIRQLGWTGILEFLKAEKQIWNSEYGVLGTAKNHKNFTFVTVYKAGHMVPFYQPYSAVDMVLRYVSNNSNWTKPIHH